LAFNDRGEIRRPVLHTDIQAPPARDYASRFAGYLPQMGALPTS